MGLGNYDDDEVSCKLIRLLGDPDPGVVVAAYRSLEHLSDSTSAHAPRKWQEWFDSRTHPSEPAPSSPRAPGARHRELPCRLPPMKRPSSVSAVESPLFHGRAGTGVESHTRSRIPR